MKREAKLEEIIWKYLCAVIDLEDGKQLAQAIAQNEREMFWKKADNYDGQGDAYVYLYEALFGKDNTQESEGE